MTNITNTLYRFAFWPLFFVVHLLAICLLAWHLLAQVSFAYPLGYQLIGIDKHILEFAPTNRFKHEFEFTTPKQQWKIFAEITHAVQNNGQGLAEISYPLPNGSRTPLMHDAEVIHLQDVANLISLLYIIGISSALIWCALLMLAYRTKRSFPPLKKILLGFISGVVVITIIVISAGATKIFYWLHTKIFPDGHQWFFYYEDSLMTTLMKAPDIFAFIGLLLISLIVILWVASAWGMNIALKKHKISDITQAAQKINAPIKTSKRKKRT